MALLIKAVTLKMRKAVWVWKDGYIVFFRHVQARHGYKKGTETEKAIKYLKLCETKIM